jgi:hypothetical protein
MDVISVCRNYDIQTNKPTDVLWILHNDIEGAEKIQSKDLSRPTVLQHFVAEGGLTDFNLKLINDDTEMSFVLVDDE